MGGMFSALLGNSAQPYQTYDVQEHNPYTINQEAYKNPVGDQSANWNAGMNNMLNATTGSAPQAGTTLLADPAKMGPTATYGGAKLNGAQYNQTFNQEQGLANQLGMQAQGLGPSVAQVTAQQQGQQNLANQMAMLGSQRGSSNPALAQMAASNAGANAQQQAAQQAVLGRTQEELGAQANYGNVLGAMNQQAQGWQGTQAGLQQQAALASMGAINAQNQGQAQLYQQSAIEQGQMNQQTQMANLQAALQQGKINADQYNQYMQMLQQQNMSQYAGQQAGQDAMLKQQLGLGQIQSGNANQTSSNIMGTTGGIASGIGSALAFISDRNAKKNIGSADKQLNKALNNVYTNGALSFLF